MKHLTPDLISEVFAAYAKNSPDPRIRQLLIGLAQHLHAFVRETRLTHDEWRAGLDALTRSGQISDATRNEFVLFSDLLGISSLVDMQNSPVGATSSSVLGPFHSMTAPELTNGGDLWRGQPGEPLAIVGSVISAQSGAPIKGVTLNVWQNADNGLYAAMDPAQQPMNYHAVIRCDPEGRFCFTTTRWRPYQVPYDGPAGDMLRALGRDAWRPSHLHLIAEADDYEPLVTEFFPEDDPYLESDAAFGVRRDLIVKLQPSYNRESLPSELVARHRLPLPFLLGELTIRLAPAT